ncbi:(Fe-S)-binding protein [Clostridia bacterium]|nr:(Fe-S)-binding protein [Clostridia bacterium]
MPKVQFSNSATSVFVPDGSTVLEAARIANITLEAPCNGMGTCGKCRIKLESEQADYVLACRTTVEEDVTVFLENKEQENRSMKILGEGQSFSYTLKPCIVKNYDAGKTKVIHRTGIVGTEEGDTTKSIYGISVDIGTTTLVTTLIDLRTGESLATEHALNPQSEYAQDVLSRIHFASKDNGIEILQTSLNKALNGMIEKMSKTAHIDSNHIYKLVYSGNTAMLHMACGIDPKSLGQYPYVSQLVGNTHVSANQLTVSPFAKIYLPPIISAFVGADITSGILASQLFARGDTTIFIDVGTNGEMVLARKGTLAATSTAAGPAFEGMNITCGMRAAEGALERFSIDEDNQISYSVIGGGKARGICGSGLLDLTGELVRSGVIGKNGKFILPEKSPVKGLGKLDGKTAFFITDEVYLTQKDVRQIQLAKGAIRSGIEALLIQLDMTAQEVDRVEIAGSFGYHLSESSLLDLGLLPPDFKGKVSFVGNTSSSGGAAFLLNTDFRDEMAALVQTIEKIELSNSEGFEKLFVKALGF